MPKPQVSKPDNPEIASLTSRATEQNNALDHWNNLIILALIVTALAAIAVVTFQRLANAEAKKLSNTQDKLAEAKDTTFKLELKTKDAELATELKAKDEKIAEAGLAAESAKNEAAKANERATASEAKIAQAQKQSAEQQTKIIQAEQQIAEAAKHAALANERAAVAQHAAETEKLERIKLEELVAPRRLSVDAQLRLTETLRHFSGSKKLVTVDWYRSDVEAAGLGLQLMVATISAPISGGSAQGSKLPGRLLIQGIWISPPDSPIAKAIRDDLQAAGLEVRLGESIPNEMFDSASDLVRTPADIGAEIFIGAKPLKVDLQKSRRQILSGK